MNLLAMLLFAPATHAVSPTTLVVIGASFVIVVGIALAIGTAIRK